MKGFEELANKIVPLLTKEDKINLQDYFNFSIAHKSELDENTEKGLENHSFFGKYLRETPKRIREEQRQHSVKLQKKAFFEDNWDGYIRHLIMQGVNFARMGLDFNSWYDVIGIMRAYVVPKLLAENKMDRDYIISVINGMNKLIDVAMCAIGEAYILEKKNIVERQKKKQEQLNKELEQFIYIASHDLQEPLITIRGLSKMLNKKLQDNPDQMIHENLSYIDDSLERMTSLITGLLEYSRVGRKSELSETDLNEPLKEVIADLQASIQESKANVTYDNLPVLNVHPLEIKLLFQNLLSNAIKFRRKNICPEIHISCKEKKEDYQFTFEDNGIGISKNDLDKVFVIFKRLNNMKDYQGTGIGLSHCKKIVELHNGEIWVKSRTNEGSKFHFTLPKPE